MKSTVKTAIAIVTVIAFLSSGFLIAQESYGDYTEESTGTVVIGTSSYNSLDDAISAASDGDVLYLSGELRTNDVFETIDKSISLVGIDDAIISNGGLDKEYILKIEHKPGLDVKISNITFEGYAVSGMLKLSKSNESSENTEIPKLSVMNCKFIGEGPIGPSNCGIGFFGNGGAKSETTISGCYFENIKEAIYLDDGTAQPNTNVTIKGNSFSNIIYHAVYGCLTDVTIDGNHFDNTVFGAVGYILSADNQNTNVSIVNNTIDSRLGVDIAPYRLNKDNGKGDTESIPVTKDMMPIIKENIRNVDSNIASISLYRPGSDELLYLADDALDISDNYAAGSVPRVDFIMNGADGVDQGRIDEVNSRTENSVIVEEYYIDPGLNVKKDVSESTSPGFDDDDEFPFIPGQSSSGKDNTTTYIAVAAAAAVVAVLAVLVMAMSKGKL